MANDSFKKNILKILNIGYLILVQNNKDTPDFWGRVYNANSWFYSCNFFRFSIFRERFWFFNRWHDSKVKVRAVDREIQHIVLQKFLLV